MKTLQEHYTAIKNGKGNKAQFLKQARQLFPQYFNQYTDFNTATNVLKSKQIINEAAGGVVSKGFDIWDWKKILAEEKELKTGDILKHKSTGAEFKITKISGNNIEGKYTKLGDMEGKVKIGDTNKTNKNLIGKTYELISESVKAVEKNVSKEVEDVYKHAYDNKDMKNADNINFNEIMKGFYCELKDSKNSGKTGDELKDIVVKNLAKDPLYYTKNGEFGVKDLGYTTEAPGLGEPKEPKGKYKSSGYGDIEKAEKVKANVQDSLGDKEAKTSMPKKVKEMPVAAQNSSGVKKMATPGAEKRIKLKEDIGMFHDPIGYKKSEPSDLDKMFTKEYKGNGVYVIYKNGKEVKTIEGEGNANAWINNEMRKLKEGIQDRADAINDFAKLVKTGTNDEIANTFEANRDYPETSNIKVSEMVKILKKYGKHDDVMALIDNEFIDPAGGRGLSSHMEEQKLRSIIRNIIKEELNEYGMDSGGQDMTWGMYNRSTSKKDQGNKDFIDKGYYDYYDDIPFNTPAYEFGKNKYYGGADLAKLWQLGWKKAEAEDKGIEFVEDESNVKDWDDQTGDYDEANLNETK